MSKCPVCKVDAPEEAACSICGAIKDVFATALDIQIALVAGTLGAEPTNYADFQQRRGRLPDLIEEAIAIHDDFMLDDDFDAYGCLDKIVTKLKTARDFYDATIADRNPTGGDVKQAPSRSDESGGAATQQSHNTSPITQSTD